MGRVFLCSKPMKKGRPTAYSKELVDKICARIAAGESLVKICKDKKVGVSYATVHSWLNDKEKKYFLDNYERAREIQADYMAENIIDIADNTTLSPEEKRIKIDVRKWYAGKVKPKKYGERITQELTGKDGGPIETKNTVQFYLPSNGRDNTN